MSRDSSFPKEGLYFEDARRRAVRIAKNPTIDPIRKNQLVSSLKNQARLHQGEGAAAEIQKEVNSDFLGCYDNHSLPRLGYSPRYADNYDRIFKNS